MKRVALLAMIGVTGILMGGCIAVSTNAEIDNSGERKAVKFESRKAADIFYDKVSKKKRSAFESKSTIVLLGLYMGQSAKFDRTAFMNEQVMRADINGNGTITLKEAEEYK